MNQLFIAYKDFWGQFVNPYTNQQVQAFQEGYVTVRVGNSWQPPQFPYIVYPVVKTSFAESTLINVTVWDKAAQPGMFATVNAIVKQITDIITEEGVILSLGAEGAVWLTRSQPLVVYPPGDPDDPTIVRGVLNLIIRGYTL